MFLTTGAKIFYHSLSIGKIHKFFILYYECHKTILLKKKHKTLNSIIQFGKVHFFLYLLQISYQVDFQILREERGNLFCLSIWQSKALVTNTLTNIVRTIFDHLRNGRKIVCTAFARVFVTKALNLSNLTFQIPYSILNWNRHRHFHDFSHINRPISNLDVMWLYLSMTLYFLSQNYSLSKASPVMPH